MSAIASPGSIVCSSSMVEKEVVPRAGSKVPITHHLTKGDSLAAKPSMLK